MELTYSGKKELIEKLLGWANEEPNGLAAKIFENAEVVDGIANFLGITELVLQPIQDLGIVVKTNNTLPPDAEPGRGVGNQFNMLKISSGMTMTELQKQIQRLVGAEGSADRWEIA